MAGEERGKTTKVQSALYLHILNLFLFKIATTPCPVAHKGLIDWQGSDIDVQAQRVGDPGNSQLAQQEWAPHLPEALQ